MDSTYSIAFAEWRPGGRAQMATHPAFFVTRADGTTRVVALAMSERVQQAIVEADRGNETRDAKTLVEGVTLR